MNARRYNNFINHIARNIGNPSYPWTYLRPREQFNMRRQARRILDAVRVEEMLTLLGEAKRQVDPALAARIDALLA